MSHPAIRNVLRAAALTDPAGAADADLLGRFAATRDESAFELLVWRHAALVQRVCKAVLRDHHAAEDAAQATFLALARKAHTFTGRGSVVGWLYRVARRIAVRLAKNQARRPTSSPELDRVPSAETQPESSPDELAALCTEVDRLPERYRIPILLCFFEGLTHQEAARRTNWPVGSIAGRLARAKDILARRLSRKGVGLAAITLAMPAGSFIGGTAHAAATFTACEESFGWIGVLLMFGSKGRKGTTQTPDTPIHPKLREVVPGVDSSVIQLAEGALKTMTLSTWKLSATAAALVCAVTAGVWGFTTSPVPAPIPSQPTSPVAASVPEPKPPAAGERVADAKQRAQSRNNLKQILIALHNYHDTNGFFPQNITDDNGKPLLSWRVQLLPYVEADNLYKQFKLDEPWDSDNNKKLLTEMPVCFRVGFEPKDSTKTYYQAFAGTGTAFDPNKQIKITDITDGTSNTIAVIEAGPPVEWTKPVDLPYDPKKLPKLEGPFKNTIIAATADGATHPLVPDIDETSLHRLIGIADGEVVSLDELRATFPLTKEEVQAAQDMLKQNEKLITAIGDQLRSQQKLLTELAKKANPKDPIQGIDFERIQRIQNELEYLLRVLKTETQELQKQLDKKPDPPPPATPKK
ncbi:MAG: sigma-70 family RNA polymerase sigma factor [Planctomycetia bacterium]|nr:sigma-70 family RNA polymerase sigma factor [Planctomycetia bacterium]